MRDIISRYTKNLVDGLFNFNRNLKVEEIVKSRSGYLDAREEILIFSKLYKLYKELDGLERKVKGLLNKAKEEAEKKERGILSNLETDINRKLKELTESINNMMKSHLSILEGNFRRDLQEVLSNLSSISSVNYNILNKKLGYLVDLLHEGKYKLCKKGSNTIYFLILQERAILRAVISATYLPIHHVIVGLLQYAGVGLCKDMYSGYIRYGFRPQYEDDIHSLRWDIVRDLNCLKEKAGNSKGISDIIESIKNYLPDESSFAIKFAFYSDKSGKDENEENKGSLDSLRERLACYYLAFYKAVMERDENRIEEELKEFIKTYIDFVKQSDSLEEN